MEEFGVSLSVKQCRNFNISSLECLNWLIHACSFKRFRLMSYWDEIEPYEGQYEFTELDRQIQLIKENECSVSLCVGARQPRWPENHWPEWAWRLTAEDRSRALLNFLNTVVKRYRKHNVIVSYQLENEALLKSFGERTEVDRKRLKEEYALIKHLDKTKPIIMTTSTSWGIPFFGPIPDIVGFSYYQVVYSAQKHAYTTAFHKPWLHKIRALLIKVLLSRPSFIHELQLEPWGPKNIWEMPISEQLRSMSIKQLEINIHLARKTGIKTIDLWGGEWWFWCYMKQGRPDIIKTVLAAIKKV